MKRLFHYNIIRNVHEVLNINPNYLRDGLSIGILHSLVFDVLNCIIHIFTSLVPIL